MPDAPLVLLQALLSKADPAQCQDSHAGCTAAEHARDLARQLGSTTQQARATAWHCSHLLRQGRHADALREGLAAQALLADPGTAKALAAERLELLRVLALAGSETGAFDVALDAAHELVRLAATLGEDGPSLAAAFALAATFERMGDSWQAVRLLTQALEDHGHGVPDQPLLIATNALCAVSLGIMHRLLGLGADAEMVEVLQRARAAGERARSLLAQVADPVYDVPVLGNLGEVLMYQNELTQAEPLLRTALAAAVRRGLHAHAWRVQASLGALALKQGRPAAALAMMQALLAEMGSEAPQQTAIRVHQVAYRACRELGDFAKALLHFEVVEGQERRRATAQLRAQSQLFVTRTEAQNAQWQAEQRLQKARQDTEDQRQRAAEFAASAERDPLTGLGNRRHLQRRCTELLTTAQHELSPLCLAQIDIDHFKAINDVHGHAMGDKVLVDMAHLLRENTRAADVLVRHGGEEFVVILPGMALPQATEVCERLRERVAAQAWAAPGDLSGNAAGGGLGFGVTISVGLAAAPPHDLQALLQSADAALYRAKRGGRNRLALAD